LLTLRFIAEDDATLVTADPRPEVGTEAVATELLALLVGS
jgi:hypothetical protein